MDSTTDSRRSEAAAISELMAAIREHKPGTPLSIKPKHIGVSRFGEWLAAQGVTHRQLLDLWQDGKYVQAVEPWLRAYESQPR